MFSVEIKYIKIDRLLRKWSKLQQKVNDSINNVIMFLAECHIFIKLKLKKKILSFHTYLINGKVPLIQMHAYLSTMSSKCDIT
jgi:hypothetical protein